MIIFLDDNKLPGWYDLKPGEFTAFTDGDEALHFCQDKEIEVLYLDHELGNSMKGYKVLANLVLKYNNPPKCVVCISMDVIGIGLIEAMCKKYNIPYEHIDPPGEVFMDTGQYG